jgi:hypothetical protein
MKQVDYTPTTRDLYNGLISQNVIVYTSNTTLGGILNDVSAYFIELKSEYGVRFTYVLRDQIVAICADKESELARKK